MKNIVAVLLILLMSGCASKGPGLEPAADELYRTANEALKNGNFLNAAENLEKLESHYPFGNYARVAQLNLIYAYYKADNQAEALAAADRFIRLNPSDENLDYAFYMKGLINFNADQNILQKMLNTDFSKRDAGAARQSFQDFAELLRRFPDSRYVKDAQQRMIYLRNNLAQYEIHAARYYLNRGAYLAAVNRGKYVVENFPQTPAVADALDVMVEGYTALEMPDLALNALKTLKLNYPEHPGSHRE